MKTVLYISYDGMTDPLGQSQVIPYLKGLSKAGYTIILLSFEKKSKSYEIPVIKEQLNAYNIIWKPKRYHKKPTLPATLFDVFIGTLSTFLYCKKYKVKIIHCRGHYLTSLMAHFVKPFHKFSYIFDMRGFWADERIEGNIWSLQNPVHRLMFNFFKSLEKKHLKIADQVITLTEVAKNYIERNFQIQNEIVVIPCSTDLDLFSPKKFNTPDDQIKKSRDEGKFILVYLGSLGTWYLLDEMLSFFRILNETRPSVMLFISHESPEMIMDEAKKKGINPINIIIKKANRNDIPELLSTADAGIFFIKPVFSKTGSSPVKHGELLGCDLPVITNSGIGDLDKIINSSNTGIVLKDFNESTMKEGAKKLIELSAEKDKTRYRDTAKQYYSLEKAVNSYVKVYDRLINK